jgi:hypothetical protein
VTDYATPRFSRADGSVASRAFDRCRACAIRSPEPANADRRATAGRSEQFPASFEPKISINGLINDGTVAFFLSRLEQLRKDDRDIVLELNTSGRDADAARRIALEIQLFLGHSGRRAFCVGKTKVYSAGVSIFGAFPRHARFVTGDAVLLVHELRLENTIELKGSLRSCLQIIREQLALLETAEVLEKQGFQALIEGSSISIDETYKRATNNCYIDALRLGLIADILA